MSESTNESQPDPQQPDAGITDDQLPDDLVPSEDNPLAEGLPDGETVEGLLTDKKPGLESEDSEGSEDPAKSDETEEDA